MSKALKKIIKELHKASKMHKSQALRLEAYLSKQPEERWGKSINKVAGTATKTDPQKWEQAKKDAKAKMGGKHSARAMQLATQLYKKRGGGYSGSKPTPKSNSLKKWTYQRWGWTGGKKNKGVYLPKEKANRLKGTEEGRKKLHAAGRKKSQATKSGLQYSSHGLASGTSLKKNASIQKKSALGSMAAMSAAGHLVANNTVKSLVDSADTTKKKGFILPYTKFDRWAGKKYQNWQGDQAHQAIKRGITGESRPVSQSVIENWVAPEVTMGTHIGESIGNISRKMSRGKRKRAFKKLRKELAMNPDLRRKSAPAQAAFLGLNRILGEGLPSKGAVQPPKAKRELAANLGLGAVATVAKPSAIGHFLTNKGRVMLSKSKVGKRVAKKEFQKGVKTAIGIQPKNKVKDFLTDSLISPAVRDPGKISEALTSGAMKNPRRSRRLIGALSHFDTEGAVKGKVSDAFNVVRKMIPTERIKLLSKYK